MTWKLKRTVQCAKCPWRVDVNPHDIPNGYSEDKHRALKNTIAEPGSVDLSDEFHVMACHEEHESHCIGWLVHQAGDGNNIGLRIRPMDCENFRKVRTVGDQHKTFEETLPCPTK